jgi:hypothetical protein
MAGPAAFSQHQDIPFVFRTSTFASAVPESWAEEIPAMRRDRGFPEQQKHEDSDKIPLLATEFRCCPRVLVAGRAGVKFFRW